MGQGIPHGSACRNLAAGQPEATACGSAGQQRSPGESATSWRRWVAGGGGHAVQLGLHRTFAIDRTRLGSGEAREGGQMVGRESAEYCVDGMPACCRGLPHGG